MQRIIAYGLISLILACFWAGLSACLVMDGSAPAGIVPTVFAITLVVSFMALSMCAVSSEVKDERDSG